MATIFFFLVSGCAGELPQVTADPVSVEDRERIIAVLHAWEQHFGVMSDEAREKMSDVLVTDAATVDVFHTKCRVCTYSSIDPDCDISYGRYESTGQPYIPRGAACVASENQVVGPLGMFSPSAMWRLIVIAPMDPSWSQEVRRAKRHSLIVHEAVHWAGIFSGHGADNSHSDVRRWCSGACGSGSVEGDARTALVN